MRLAALTESVVCEGRNPESTCFRFEVVERHLPWHHEQDTEDRHTGSFLEPLEKPMQSISVEAAQVLPHPHCTETQTAVDSSSRYDEPAPLAGTQDTSQEREAATLLSEDEVDTEIASIAIRQDLSPPSRILPASSSHQPSFLPRSKLSLCGLPAEILHYIVQDLDEISKISLKYTNRYLHASTRTKCAKALGIRKGLHLLDHLERDVDVDRYQALLLCPNCNHFTLRALVPGRSPNRRWALSRLSYREELRSCCNIPMPPGSTALPLTQLGVPSFELRVAEKQIDVKNPGMVLILICLHCSAENPYTGEDTKDMSCSRCWCRTCPLVFMPRKLSLTAAKE